ncbi:hypothetical protein OHS17_03330 [Streptomyces sp. NBC_00523]|nr:acyl-CoA dehydrogenase [Streptomyces sp. NBC_00523]WUC98741.1 hypothetical protein OHS17_03330 [Streptomyces sp. NBC_00523]
MASPTAVRISVSKVRPLAVDLVDAWGIPDEMLRAPDLVG